MPLGTHGGVIVLYSQMRISHVKERRAKEEDASKGIIRCKVGKRGASAKPSMTRPSARKCRPARR